MENEGKGKGGGWGADRQRNRQVNAHAFVKLFSGRKKAHKHKLFALVNVRMALGQTAGCPRVNRAKKFMCSPRNTGNINFSLWLTGGLSQGCPDFQKVYVFKVYVPFSCPILFSKLPFSFSPSVSSGFWFRFCSYCPTTGGAARGWLRLGRDLDRDVGEPNLHGVAHHEKKGSAWGA